MSILTQVIYQSNLRFVILSKELTQGSIWTLELGLIASSGPCRWWRGAWSHEQLAALAVSRALSFRHVGSHS